MKVRGFRWCRNPNYRLMTVDMTKLTLSEGAIETYVYYDAKDDVSHL